jgi:predicted AAA+ superfamily ATPase
MDSILNPFRPGAGFRPRVLAGREVILDRFDVLLARMQRGIPTTPIFLYGLRGVGKTVLLIEIERMAQRKDFFVDRFEVDESDNYNFQAAIFNRLKSILLRMDTIENLKDKFARALGIMKSISLNYQGVELSLDINPSLGEADSRNFQDDLMTLMAQVGQIAQAKNKGVCLLIDELQNLSDLELSAVLGAQHRMIQEEYPITIIGAGLPSLLTLVASAKSYAERFQFVEVGPLSRADAALAIVGPIQEGETSISPEAVEELVNVTKGYPYFIQQFGETLWLEAEGPTITQEDAKKAIPKAIALLDESFFKTRFERSTEEEKRFMLCMAELGKAPYETSSIGKCLQRSPQHVGQYRDKLMRKGFIYSISHGKVDFTVPLFAEFLLRQNKG